MIYNEGTLALLSLLTGGAFGLVWDLIRPLRRGKIWNFVWDVLLFLLLGMWDFLFLLYWCEGYVRGFVFLLEGLGFCLYGLCLHPITSFIQKWIWRIIRAVFYPVKIIWIKTTAPAVFRCRKMWENVKKTLKSLCKKVYNCYIFLLRRQGGKGGKGSDDQKE